MRTRIIARSLLITLAAGALLALARRSEQTAPSPPPREAQSTYEPRTAPGAGQVLLAQFAGLWDVEKTFYPIKGDPVRTLGECRQTMIHNGHFLQSDFTFVDKNGAKSTGTGISGFDPKANRFTTVWYDSRQTTMSIRQSDGTFDGKNIVLYATALDPDQPGRRTVARAHLEENGRVLVHRHFLIDDSGNERMMIELRLTRKDTTRAPGSR